MHHIYLILKLLKNQYFKIKDRLKIEELAQLCRKNILVLRLTSSISTIINFKFLFRVPDRNTKRLMISQLLFACSIINYFNRILCQSSTLIHANWFYFKLNYTVQSHSSHCLWGWKGREDLFKWSLEGVSVPSLPMTSIQPGVLWQIILSIAFEANCCTIQVAYLVKTKQRMLWMVLQTESQRDTTLPFH